MDVGLHHRGVDAHASAFSQAMALCHGHHPDVDLFDHVCPQCHAPAPHGLGVRGLQTTPELCRLQPRNGGMRDALGAADLHQRALSCMTTLFLVIPALRLSGTSAATTPPMAANALTCAPIQSGSVSVQRASA